MAQFCPIHEPQDPRLADYVRLRDVSLRRSLEAAEGLFIAEGEKVIRRAAAAGYTPRSFLLAPRWIAGLSDILDACQAPVYVVSEDLAEQVTGFHVHRGALASFERHTRWRTEDLLGFDRLLVCEDLVDHSNVGAIVRAAAGLGWGGVLFAPRCADPLYRRAIKTSMGAVFSLLWARMTDWQGGLQQLKNAGFTVVAMALRPDAVTLDELADDLRARPRRIALVVGTEGAGLSAHWLGESDVVMQIPMGHGVDSLNVAAAAAVACYVLSPERA